MYRKILVPLDGSKVAEGVLPASRYPNQVSKIAPRCFPTKLIKLGNLA
jgi:hypothetical protein